MAVGAHYQISRGSFLNRELVVFNIGYRARASSMLQVNNDGIAVPH